MGGAKGASDLWFPKREDNNRQFPIHYQTIQNLYYKSKLKEPFLIHSTYPWIQIVVVCIMRDNIYQSCLAPTSVSFGRLENCLVTSSHSCQSGVQGKHSQKNLTKEYKTKIVCLKNRHVPYSALTVAPEWFVLVKPVWLVFAVASLICKPFYCTFESTQWRKVKPVWLWYLVACQPDVLWDHMRSTRLLFA